MTWPVANAEWWQRKIERNIARDRDTDRRLFDAGWTVIRVWEHENPLFAAARVESALSRRTQMEKDETHSRNSEGD